MDEDWCKEIERRFFEDKKSNEDFPTIHGVTLSESYLYKRTKPKNIHLRMGPEEFYNRNRLKLINRETLFEMRVKSLDWMLVIIKVLFEEEQ